MDKVSTFVSRRPTLALTVAALLGLGLGLLIGWVVWPVQWTDAGPQHLRADLQEQYLKNVAMRLQVDNDVQAAQAALADWSEADAAIQALIRQPTTTEEERRQLDQLSRALASGAGEVPASADLFGAVRNIGLVCLAGLLAVALIGGAWTLVQGRLGRAHPALMEEDEAFGEPDVVVGFQGERDESRGESVARRPSFAGSGPVVRSTTPVGQFTTTYEFGNDSYDDSNTIESENGEFLGEYGISIAEAIGVGEPRKVTALEVWLFDKNDIRTVTQVLMSEHAYYDDAFRAKLAPKGEAVLARVGETLVLETASLTLHARVVDLEYREGNLPPQSVFERVTLEMTAWARPNEQAPGVRRQAVRGL
ncbi:MAG: hypothetical protein C4309_07720 [Chloroflexota bacterium]